MSTPENMGAKHRASPPLQEVGDMSPVHQRIYGHAIGVARRAAGGTDAPWVSIPRKVAEFVGLTFGCYTHYAYKCIYYFQAEELKNYWGRRGLNPLSDPTSMPDLK